MGSTNLYNPESFANKTLSAIVTVALPDHTTAGALIIIVLVAMWPLMCRSRSEDVTAILALFGRIKPG